MLQRLSSFRRSLIALILICASPVPLAPSSAYADGYAGAMIGLGVPMGTSADIDSGTVYGATLGYRLLPTLAIAGTYLHDGLHTSLGKFDYTVNQYLAEANFFTFFLMNGGIHAGPINTKFLGTSTTDLGLGLHLGFDLNITDRITIGAAAYWTYVTATDKYSTLNLMVPAKIWF